MTIIFNIKRMTERRRQLRKTAPKAEILLWRYLRGRQIGGYKFRRQASIGGFVVDFYCPRLRLAIEVDGPSHFQSEAAIKRDRIRQRCIEDLGVRFFRITNADVYNNLDGVIKDLVEIVSRINRQ